MARTVKEWCGKTDDAQPSASCKRRILDRQDNKCAISDRPFTAKDRPEFDHKTPLWLGGKNCESNLQAIHKQQHKDKTKTEAAVRSKVNAQRDKDLGLKKTKNPMPGSRASGWKRRFDGTVVRRQN